MKKHIYLLALLFVTHLAEGQQEKAVDSKISHVTVFLSKAQVTREVKTRIGEGRTDLIFSGLTSVIDPNSIQVSATGNFTLLGITHRQNFLNDQPVSGRMKILKDSVEDLKQKITLETVEKQILDKEEQMLLSNQKIGGTEQSLPVEELKNMADFFRRRLIEIASARLRHDEAIKEITERLSKVEQQLRSQNELASRHSSEIVVSVSSKSTTEANLLLNYVVSNAGWVPLYDLRASNTREPLTLHYKANVYQRTGENWNNVRLKLSTANPTSGSVKPELRPWELDYYQRDYYRKLRERATAPAPAAIGKSESAQAAADAGTVADFVTVQQTAVNTEFDISVPYTVNSAAQPTVVDIGRYEMKASYQYVVTPKLDPDAFLMAGTTGWSDLNLLPGQANVFFEGGFVGKTFIDPASFRDTLFISMGRDKRIVVKREKIKDFNSHAVIGLNQKQLHGFEINVRNNKAEPITITVEDQIPVSKNSEIEVSATDLGGAALTPLNGKLEWDITLKPNESRRLFYQFEVKFPKEKLVAGLNYD